MSEPKISPPALPDPVPIRDKEPKPLGLFPRHLQTWFVAGIAGVIVLVILATGQPPTARPTANGPKPISTVDANQVRIQEYRERLEEQVRRLQAEQAELAAAKQSLANPPRGTGVGSADATPSGADASAASAQASITQDQTQRAYRALYADNVAWSAAHPTTGSAGSVDVTPPARTGAPLRVVPPAIAPLATSGPVAPSLPAAAAPLTAEPMAPVPDVATGRRAPDGRASATFVLLEGTVIDAVLTNRLDGASSGPVNAMVTTPTYARGYQDVLIPRGSRLLGTSSPVAQFGQQRLAVAFHRLVFPDGRFVSLEKLPAMNPRGDVGLKDLVDQHLLQIFGTSLAIGALAGLAQVNSGVGLDQSWTDAYRQGVASSVTQSSMRILDRFLNQLPTVTIREGHRLKVYLTSDLRLPAYREDRPVDGIRH